MIWTVLMFIIPMFIFAAIGESIQYYIDYRREKYGRFINVNFRKQWM